MARDGRRIMTGKGEDEEILRKVKKTRKTIHLSENRKSNWIGPY